MFVLGTGPYLGRVISYLCAATATWFLNRHFTFADSRGERLLGEWLRFAAFNASGGLVNYGVYALCLHLLGQAQPIPLLGVAAGSLSGLVVNYTASRHLVFTRGATCP
jgi:putative flippase GtrA